MMLTVADEILQPDSATAPVMMVGVEVRRLAGRSGRRVDLPPGIAGGHQHHVSGLFAKP
jgi:hypothetical protein